jgi:DNA-binding helix-hairpin-helix protein with protein kinase domain
VSLTAGSGRVVAVGRRLAAGGQGEVFAVASPQGFVFKKYLRAALGGDPALERRLRAMVAHPPVEWREPRSGHVTLAWPSDVVLEDGIFAGFLMPAVDMDDTVSLHRVTNPTDRGAATGATSWAQGFTWKYLVHSAANLAHATDILHRSGTVIGDFNESNLRVTREARITFLDCDSMQISDPVSGERFFTGVGRPEWTPPELLNADWKTTVRHPSSDLFALAIHIYQLLLEGEHPFRGIWSGAGDKPWVPELARQGIWAHQRGGPLSPRPNAIGIGLLPPSITGMFRKAFEDGAVNPAARPTADEWQQALADLEADLRRCKANQAHFYPGSHTTCAWCGHSRRSGPQTSLPPAAAPIPPPQWPRTPPQPVQLTPQFNPPPAAPRPPPAIVPRPRQATGPVARPRRRNPAIRAGAILVAAIGLALAIGWVWGIVVLIEKQVAAGGAHSAAPYGLFALLLGIAGLPILGMIGAAVFNQFR